MVDRPTKGPTMQDNTTSEAPFQACFNFLCRTVSKLVEPHASSEEKSHHAGPEDAAANLPTVQILAAVRRLTQLSVILVSGYRRPD